MSLSHAKKFDSLQKMKPRSITKWLNRLSIPQIKSRIKLSRKGRRNIPRRYNIMKKIIRLIAMLTVLASAGFAANNNYTVALDTYAIVTADTAASIPNISGDVELKKVILANTGATIQTISFYEDATSTTAATAFMTIVLESTGTYVYDFANGSSGVNVAECKNLAIKKSATASTVTATVFYK